MPSFTRQQLENWLKTIDVKADRVLDVGGAQKPVKSRTASWEVEDYIIFDLENPHEGESPDFAMDLNEYIDAPNEQKADVVFCLEVMEYVYDPFNSIMNLNRLLKTGGVLYISFPFIYPVHNPVQDDCLRYTKRGAEKLLEKAGFEIEQYVPRFADQPNVLMSWFHIERMRPAKNYKGHDEVGCLIKAKKL